MKVIVKKLQGGECCLEVSPDTIIAELKRKVAEKLDIPVEEQKLLLLGRTLTDEQTIQSYPTIKDGTKLNLVVKKPESLFEVSLKHFKKVGLTDSEAVSASNRLLKIVEEKFNQLSWDDIEKLSLDCLMDEYGPKRVPEHKKECENMFSL